jgi:hypothetical protein
MEGRVLKIWVSSDEMEEPVFVMVEFHLVISLKLLSESNRLLIFLLGGRNLPETILMNERLFIRVKI